MSVENIKCLFEAVENTTLLDEEDVKEIADMFEIECNEVDRKLKLLAEVIEKDNIKYQDDCLFGLRVRDLLRKENLPEG